MPTTEHLGEQAIERLNADNNEILQLAEAGAQSAKVQMQIGWGPAGGYTTEVTLVCHACAPGVFAADQLAELRRLGWEVDDDDEFATRYFPLADEVTGAAAIREAAALLVLTLSRVYAETYEPAWVEPPSPEQRAEQRAAFLAQLDAIEARDEPV